MMASECVFCAKMRSSKPEDTYEDTHFHDVISFEPLNPIVPGHRLFVHREHTRAASTDPMITGRVFEAAARYGATHEPDFNLITSDGKAATQTVMHLHVHYVPRYADDGLHLPWTNQVVHRE
jgi:histidine triad (HIT) family protein